MRRLLLFFLACFIPLAAFCDEGHYVNLPVGSRAASLGGAYLAISDDAAGCYYNPAGLAYASSDSISGSGNAFLQTRTLYTKAIGTQDWSRESGDLLPSFFGMTKKMGDWSYGISYAVPNASIEHQDQLFYDPIASVRLFNISLHSEDITSLGGVSLAYAFSDSFSLGVTYYLYQRKLLLQQQQYLTLSNGDTELSYSSIRRYDYGYLPKLGLQWSPWESFVTALTVSQVQITSSNFVADSSFLDQQGTSSNQRFSSVKLPKTPTQVALGVAYFPSAYWLFALDLNQYSAVENNQQIVTNLSLGAEWFLNKENAIRFGYFTNNDNRDLSRSPSPSESIDLIGYSFGYSSYAQNSSINIALTSQSGTGLAKLYSGLDTTRQMQQTSLSILLGASYQY